MGLTNPLFPTDKEYGFRVKMKLFFKFLLPGIVILLFVGLLLSIVILLIPTSYSQRRAGEKTFIITEGIETNKNSVSMFPKRPEVAHVDCSRLFQGEKAYLQKKMTPPRNPDTGFPVLYARLVYQDYEFLEEQLATNYASENVYCYFIDKKAPKIFHDRIHKLAECLPNVIIPPFELEMDSAGHNQNEAHLRCMEQARDRRWEYAILMQNHDVILKTHAEITEILKIYGVAKCSSANINWAKGSMQVVVSRAAVDFIFTRINVDHLVKQMNEMGYGVDEQLYASLQITPEIGLPGGFHPKCLHLKPQSVTREASWHPTYYGLGSAWNKFVRFATNEAENDCPSGRLRHASCIYGVDDLPQLAESKQIMANKMLPDFDYAVVSCVSELLFNRTRDGSEIDRAHYENINTVRYHRERSQPGFDIDQFECEKWHEIAQ